jgi:hypothetical protein
MICQDRSGAFSASASLEGSQKFDLKVDYQSPDRTHQESPCVLALNGPPAESENKVLARRQTRNGRVFEITKGALTLFGEDLGNGLPGFGLDYVVYIDESPAELLGQNWANSRFTRAHEAGQHDAPG